MYFESGSVSSSLPCSTSIMTPTLTTALLCEAMRKMRVRLHRRARFAIALPEGLQVHELPAAGDEQPRCRRACRRRRSSAARRRAASAARRTARLLPAARAAAGRTGGVGQRREQQCDSKRSDAQARERLDHRISPFGCRIRRVTSRSTRSRDRRRTRRTWQSSRSRSSNRGGSLPAAGRRFPGPPA